MIKTSLLLFIFSFHSAFAVSENSIIEADKSVEEVSSSIEVVNNNGSKHDGFFNGVKYGISYPFVFWGAEGFEKVPLSDMTASFSFGAYGTIIVLLVIAVKLFILKK